jgi:Family of unknown function (DUF6311)/Interleukin-like EMT inducer
VKNQLPLYTAVFAVALLLFWFKFGFLVLNVTNYAWLMTLSLDTPTEFLSWEFYRATPFSFPIGRIEGYQYPTVTGIGLTGAIPLLAIPFKLISNLLPVHFQYFGWWLLSCYLLQGYFSIKLLKAVGLTHFWEIFISAIFLLMSSTLLYRSGHINLCTQWLILWSFWIYYVDLPIIYKFKQSLYIVAITALIHQYLLLMVFGLMFAVSLHALYTPIKWWQMLAWNLANILLAVVIWYVIGNFIVPTDSVRGSGFGHYSANLNVFWNATDMGKLLKGLPRGEGQYEGAAYLGISILGLIILLIVNQLFKYWMFFELGMKDGKELRTVLFDFFAKKSNKTVFNSLPSFIPNSKKRKSLYLVMVACLFAIFAFSNVGFLGKTEVWNIKIFPQTLLGFICDSFRSSGRFIWVLYYLIVLLIIRWFVIQNHFLSKFKMPILAILLIIQIYDLSPLFKRENLAEIYTPPIHKGIWSDIITNIDRLVMYPPYGWSYQHYLDYVHFSMLAVENHKAITTGYLARALKDSTDKYSNRLNESLSKGEWEGDDKSLIITGLEFQPYVEKLQRSGNGTFFLLDNYIVIVPTHRKDLLSKMAEHAEIKPFHIETESINDFLNRNANNTILAAIRDEGTKNLCEEAKQYLVKMGSNIQKLGYRGSYLGVFHQNQIIFEEMDNTHLLKHYFKQGEKLQSLNFLSDIEMESAGADAGNRAKIQIGEKNEAKNTRGINFVVLDKHFKVIESTCFDTFENCYAIKKTR